MCFFFSFHYVNFRFLFFYSSGNSSQIFNCFTFFDPENMQYRNIDSIDLSKFSVFFFFLLFIYFGFRKANNIMKWDDFFFHMRMCRNVEVVVYEAKLHDRCCAQFFLCSVNNFQNSCFIWHEIMSLIKKNRYDGQSKCN